MSAGIIYFRKEDYSNIILSFVYKGIEHLVTVIYYKFYLQKRRINSFVTGLFVISLHRVNRFFLFYINFENFKICKIWFAVKFLSLLLLMQKLRRSTYTKMFVVWLINDQKKYIIFLSFMFVSTFLFFTTVRTKIW